MESKIRTYRYPSGEMQKTQAVLLDSWSELHFLEPTGSDKALDRFFGIYRDFLVPAAPWRYGNLILFRLPEDLDAPLSFETDACGHVAHRLTAAAAMLESGVQFADGAPQFQNQPAETLYRALEQRGCLRLLRGELPGTTVIPMGNRPGYLTEIQPEAALKVNASFFIMDRFDCATVFDHVGTPFGLCVQDGFVSRPPLYNREALLVRKNGAVEILPMDARMLDIEIGGQTFRHGKNCEIYTRPQFDRAPEKNQSLVIVGNRVEAVGHGALPVPASGFVLQPKNMCPAQAGDPVLYRGLEDVQFGIQVGNSILRDEKPTEQFLSAFYDIHNDPPIAYPPSLYPLDFDRDRAARIALGADKAGRPMLLWAEGAAKFGYVAGRGSCGASLSEMAFLCADAGMVHAVNLDGGGSAQILLRNRRSLQISDRTREDQREAERPVPLGLIVK